MPDPVKAVVRITSMAGDGLIRDRARAHMCRIHFKTRAPESDNRSKLSSKAHRLPWIG